MRATTYGFGDLLPDSAREFARRRSQEFIGLAIIAATGAVGVSLASWSISDPSLSHATDAPIHNLLGVKGAIIADLIMQLIGVSAVVLLAPLGLLGWRVFSHRRVGRPSRYLIYWLVGTFSAAAVASLLPMTDRWPLPTGLGGVIGDALVFLPKRYLSAFGLALAGLAYLSIAILSLAASLGPGASNQKDDEKAERTDSLSQRTPWLAGSAKNFPAAARDRGRISQRSALRDVVKNLFGMNWGAPKGDREIAGGQFDELRSAFEQPFKSGDQGGPRRLVDFPSPPGPRIDGVSDPAPRPKKWGQKVATDPAPGDGANAPYVFPSTNLLAQGKKVAGTVNQDSLEQNARLLEGVLEDFSIKGDIVSVFPGPVVTLYDFEPAPGIKSSRVIGLSDDIARSMSAVSARVAVAPGRNAIGIELPNPRRETVYLRELLASPDFVETRHKLAIALGKTIGGEPVIVDLARMPHLLVAGTTGSGKSVAINTMVLSLLYRLKPQECRLIMVDPKMLELSVYDGVPHLLTPVVTDPKKAVVALKWAVREMEDRYKKMSKLGVRNIDGFNARVTEAREKGEIISRTVQTGFDRETGEAVYEQEQMDLIVLPYIVVIVDEMADLMMVAGKEIEGAIQRLAQMARAAGIHLIMATQRPSVDVITGTIKANFPTRVSFQVTSKIDSRTILGEMGAEQLLGQGDMLYMQGGGRISRVHGPFVSDVEVERSWRI